MTKPEIEKAAKQYRKNSRDLFSESAFIAGANYVREKLDAAGVISALEYYAQLSQGMGLIKLRHPDKARGALSKWTGTGSGAGMTWTFDFLMRFHKTTELEYYLCLQHLCLLRIIDLSKDPK